MIEDLSEFLKSNFEKNTYGCFRIQNDDSSSLELESGEEIDQKRHKGNTDHNDRHCRNSTQFIMRLCRRTVRHSLSLSQF